MAHGAAAVERLWDACQIPDYRRLAPAAHAELVTTLYAFLMKKGRIPDAWFAAQVDQADRVTGDIDTLSGRIAQIRTWTFVANRPDWLYDPDHWQGIAREVENKLSDALHERLTERFVDRRTSVLMRRLRENSVLNTEIGKTGEVIVEGHAIGRLDGFTFAPDAAEAGSDAKALQAAAQQVLAQRDRRARHKACRSARRSVRADVRRHHSLDRRCRGKARRRRRCAASAIAHHCRRSALRRAARGGAGAARSLAEDAYRKAAGAAVRLVESRGHHRYRARHRVPARRGARRAGARKDFRRDEGSRPGLARDFTQIRRALRRLSHLFPRAVEARRARAGFAAVGREAGQCDMSALSGAQHLASSGRMRFRSTRRCTATPYRLLGYRQCGERAVRVDILERLADLIRPALAWRESSPAKSRPARSTAAVLW